MDTDVPPSAANGNGLGQETRAMSETEQYHDRWSAELYDYRLGHHREDIELWLGLAKEGGETALELACGTGRATLEMARRGQQIVGLDRSPYMLEMARRKLAEEATEVQARTRLVEGDMADFDLGETFGLVFIPARSYQILPTREAQRGCLLSCARHLQRGGLLAIQLFNPSLSRLIAPGGIDEEPDEFTAHDGAAVLNTGHADYNLAEQTLLWTDRYECRGADGSVTRRTYLLPMRYVFRFEMEWALEACGFAVDRLWGDFAKSEFRADSPEMIFIARRSGRGA
jgi:SAM-dependent methyltransferase